MTERGAVLVVDDDPSIRMAVSWALSDEGYAVTVAENGRVALDYVTAHRPDLVLLDMRMPVMDGWELARQYRELPGPHAPIVVMTAARDARERAHQIRADGYLAKPFDVDDLLALVHRHVPRC